MDAPPDTTRDDPGARQALVLASDLRVLLGRLRRGLRDQSAPHDLTWAQKSVLVRLERDGPATVTTLARAEGMRPQSLGATVATLLASGLIEGSPDPADGRRTILSLTPACRDWISAGRAAREDWLFRAIRSRLDDTEQHQLVAALALLRRLVEP
ncbi:MarR family winged helix-turn-helix transcriptional regulator [Lichenicola sp.]|uniref:MarR family winged helix-turn-helix transcriptional regulator n=1 Tax=Lichenicola sp. TaxID=2804529 RepID=UPI003B0085DB